MKSVSEIFVEDLIANGILWIAPDANPASWKTLKNGTQSPLYWDVRAIQSYPDLLKKSSYLLRNKIRQLGLDFNRIAAVPYGALCLGYAVAYDMGKPVVTPRKEGAKGHGDKKDVVGNFMPNDRALIIEDVVTSATSIIEARDVLLSSKINVKDAVVLIDREQGGKQKLAEQGISLHPVLTQTSAIQKIPRNHPMRDIVMNYLRQNERH